MERMELQIVAAAGVLLTTTLAAVLAVPASSS
jgi:hypothetical protein